jgi:fermentation-respiration switch protein FrsA (DUF1100 family)
MSLPFWRRSWKHRLARSVLVAGCCYLGVLLVLMALENSLVYHPSRGMEKPPPPLHAEDLMLPTAAGPRIHAWWCPREKARGALLYCHGNAGNLSHRGGAVVTLQQLLGESVLIFDYPGYGRSEGKPSEAGCYAAADAAYDWLTQTQKIPADRIILYGGSLGGAVAVDLASRRPHRALVLIKTFTTLPDVAARLHPWLPVRWLMRNRFPSVTKIGQCKQPVFIAHGTTDGLIPFDQGERLYAAANQPKHFCAMPGVDHNDPLTAQCFEELRQFLARTDTTSPRELGAGAAEK